MKILLNFLPLRTGGGLQVGLDFLANLKKYGSTDQWVLLARDIPAFQNFTDNAIFDEVILIKDNVLSRLYFEHVHSQALVDKFQIDVVYTQFGPTLPVHNVVKVSGCAYSNLFYPEIDFWKNEPWHIQVKNALRDIYRKKSLLKSDINIFETPDLKLRCCEQLKLSHSKVKYVLPAVSSLVNDNPLVSGEFNDKLARESSDSFTLCYISGFHSNKNLNILIDVASELRRQSIRGIKFILTLPTDQQAVVDYFNRVSENELDSYFCNMGKIPSDYCATVYHYANASILPSYLESFSNNIAESWATRTPLLITDASWSRSLCDDAALYIDNRDAKAIAAKIAELKADMMLQKRLIQSGEVQLSKYPSSSERFSQYLDIISSVTAEAPREAHI